jgi:hypothetical protein
MVTGGLKQINKLIKGQNTIGFIKMQRLSRLGHVESMADDNIKKIKRWKPMPKRPFGRPKTHLEDIKSMKVCDWKNVAQNTDRWKKVVEQARPLYRL